MTFEIDDRLYNNIQEWCDVNGIDSKSYILSAIRMRFNLDKYGDLNEKVNKTNDSPQTIETNSVIEIKHEIEIVKQEPILKVESVEMENNEKPKRGRPKKKVIQSK